jgi:hypothetical protein
LDRVLDTLEELGKKHSLLLLARDTDIGPGIDGDWRAIFRVPWER